MSNGLGRGLSSLIPQKVNKTAAADGGIAVSVSSESEKDRVLRIEVGKIKINPAQPRKRFAEQELDELMDSIKQYGVIQPLIVSKKNGEYELIAGERRLRA
ncbi:MAG: ParB N-terminal domain-containing protein, partial [Patescibacteria group bacterium]